MKCFFGGLKLRRIVILSNDHEYTYNLRKELIQELINNNYKVYLVLPYGKKVDSLQKMGCEFINVPLDKRGVNPFTDLKLIRKYYKIIKKIQPHLVLSYTIKPNIYGGLVCRMRKVPHYPNITGLGSSIEKEGAVREIVIKLYQLGLNKSRTIFFQNEINKNYFIEKVFEPKRYRLITGSGINLEEYQYKGYPINNKEINLLFVGRIMVEKGVLELLHAIKYFKNKPYKINFHVVGSIEEKELENRLRAFDDKNKLRYHGYQSDTSSFLKVSHAIILPSYHEGMSNVLLEAAASGRPILASNIPGCLETFDEGITGFGFEAKSTESLIEAIEKFIELPYEEKEKMGVLGRQKMENEFDRQQVVDAYMEEIENIK